MYINGLQEQTLNIDNTSLDHITSFSAATCHKNDFCQFVTLHKGEGPILGWAGWLGSEGHTGRGTQIAICIKNAIHNFFYNF